MSNIKSEILNKYFRMELEKIGEKEGISAETVDEIELLHHTYQNKLLKAIANSIFGKGEHA